MTITKASASCKNLLLLAIAVFFCIISANGQFNVNHYLNQSKQHLIDEHPRKAMPYLNRIVRMNDRHYQAYFLRGVAKYQLQDYYGAKQDFNRAIELNPYYTDAFHYRGIVKSRRHNYYGALRDFKRGLEISPYRPQIIINKGITHLSISQYATAIEAFNRALKLSSENPRALLFRGRALEKLGQQDSAMQDYNHSINKDPFSYQAFIFRGDLYRKKGKYIKALEDFRRAIRIEDHNPQAWFNRARIKMEMEDYAGAVQDFTRVIQRAPQSAVAYYNRALAYSQQEKFDKALADYNKVLEINPDHPITYFNRGIIYTQKANYEQALRDYTNALERIPDFEEAYLNRSLVYKRMGRHAKALEDRQKASQINRYKNTPAYQSRDTTQLAQMIQLDANFDEKLNSNKQNIAAIMQNPSTLQLMPLITLQAQKTQQNFFSALISRYNAQTADSLYLVFTDSVNQQSNIPATSGNHTQILRALSQRLKLNFNKAIAILAEPETSGSFRSLSHFARGNSYALMTDFIRNLDADAPTISYRQQETGSTQQTESYDYSPAIKALQQALDYAPNFAPALYNSGVLYARMGNFNKAKTLFTKAIEQKPDFGKAYFNRAVMHFKTNAQKRGCSDLSKAGNYGVKEAYQALKVVCDM